MRPNFRIIFCKISALIFHINQYTSLKLCNQIDQKSKKEFFSFCYCLFLAICFIIMIFVLNDTKKKFIKL